MQKIEQKDRDTKIIFKLRKETCNGGENNR